jgi:YggT family protein
MRTRASLLLALLLPALAVGFAPSNGPAKLPRARPAMLRPRLTTPPSTSMTQRPSNTPDRPLPMPDSRTATAAVAVMTAVAAASLPVAAHAVDASLGVALAIRPVLDAFIYIMNFLFVCRTVISWYPKTNLKELPFSAIVCPTEPLLAPAREIVPPAFGVDVSAIVWIALLSFLHEILTGQQGILTLLEKQ